MAVDPIRDVPLDELREWDENPRRISDDALQALMRSMEADPSMLHARPLMALRDGRVIGGNMRLKAARGLGWETIPAVLVDLDEATAKTWALRDNNSYGEWDDQALAQMLADLDREGLDLSLTGFTPDELSDYLDALPDDPPPGMSAGAGSNLQIADVSIGDPQRLPAKGDTWKVGHHYLVVADVYGGWEAWAAYLEGERLCVPYPTPTLPLTERAEQVSLVLVQPDPWLAGHLLDKYAAVNGDDSVARVK